MLVLAFVVESLICHPVTAEWQRRHSRRGLFDKHKLIVATMLVLRVMQRRNDAPGEQIEYLCTGKRVPNPPNMTTKVQEVLTDV